MIAETAQTTQTVVPTTTDLNRDSATSSPVDNKINNSNDDFVDKAVTQNKIISFDESAPTKRSMKLRKSRFRFGSFAFGHGGGSQAVTSTNSAVSTNPSAEPSSKLSSEMKIRSASTVSLLRRSHSRCEADMIVDNSVNSSTPVLLAVRKRSTSDSGLDEAASGSSQNCSPVTANGDRKFSTAAAAPKMNPAKPSPTAKAESGGSRMGGGFFRIFNKSATLLFKHPTTELNPNKPYKGTVTTSLGHHGRKASTLATSTTGGASSHRHTAEDVTFYRRHHRWPSLSRLDKASNPLLSPSSQLVSSSMSSLNSSSIMPLHHQAAYSSSGEDSGRPSGVSGASGAGKSTKKGSTSSANSVISSSDIDEEEGSNYDSGAFSRTSSPDGVGASGIGAGSRSVPYLLNASSMSISRLPPTEPLMAPSLVLAACLEYGVPIGEGGLDRLDGEHPFSSVDASFVLSCLDAAARSSGIESLASVTSDVSVTIGANTKLTISPHEFERRNSVRRSGKLRRSRSGLPVLGTSVLQKSESPSKKLTQRNKISTVYLNTSASSLRHPNRSRVTRSESIVTVSGVTHPLINLCNCKERVTVNGQHHCCNQQQQQQPASMPHLTGGTSGDSLSERFSRIVELNSPPESEPTSLVNI